MPQKMPDIRRKCLQKLANVATTVAVHFEALASVGRMSRLLGWWHSQWENMFQSTNQTCKLYIDMSNTFNHPIYIYIYIHVLTSHFYIVHPKNMETNPLQGKYTNTYQPWLPGIYRLDHVGYHVMIFTFLMAHLEHPAPIRTWKRGPIRGPPAKTYSWWSLFWMFNPAFHGSTCIYICIYIYMYIYIYICLCVYTLYIYNIYMSTHTIRYSCM